MTLPHLDDKICRDLIAAIAIMKKPMRFNQLLKFLNGKGFKISRPTLSVHLKHLTEKELIVRTELDKQNVTYGFNNEKLHKIEEFANTAMEIQKFLEEADKEFLSESPLVQVSHVHFVMVMRSLYQLKSELLAINEPEKEFEHRLEIIVFDELPKGLGRLLGRNFKEGDDSYRKEVLQSIETLLTYYEKMWPDKQLASKLIK
ncbi:hypothetical protein MUP77_08790 [Candidatus Bathyarchaeota archaeon]|nr:hypothetical protein [Candidatus Bathyarchaeota archaeon]